MVPNDYSCYININNRTDVDIGLVDQMVASGSWPEGNPPNTIEAGGQAQIWLKDPKGQHPHPACSRRMCHKQVHPWWHVLTVVS